MDDKLRKLTGTQKEISDNSIKFHPWVINKINIVQYNERTNTA